MPSRQQIKGRIKSVRSTRQITKAMELVSASRMRRAQELAKRTRRYAEAAGDVLSNLRSQVALESYQLFAARRVKARLLIVIASDRGLAGAYNSNALRMYLGELKKDRAAGVKSYTIAIGRQAANFAARLSEANIVEVYKNLPDQPTAHTLQPIIASSVRQFIAGKVDAVDIIYTHSFSSIRQEVQSVRLLPAGFTQSPASKIFNTAAFEPSAKIVLRTATRRLIEVQLMQTMLESIASEHSMRMLAMKSASDNATELIDDYTLAYNNARQAAITQELAEITGGSEAMNS